MRIFRVGVFLGGSCPGGNFLGGSFAGWEMSRWDLSWVGIFFVGSFPGGNCPVGIIRMAIFRVGVFMLPFCSDTVFNLSSKVLMDTEINIHEQGLDFAPIQNKINQPELRKDFEEFCRRMRIKWYFRNEISENFSEKPAFTPKSKWKPPKGHPSLEVFLRLAGSLLNYSNFSKEEWQAMKSLVNDWGLVIKKADKGSCVVVWYR